jgi:RHS repeat-associated protein
MPGSATWQARPGWGIADAPYSCYDPNGNMVRRNIVTDTVTNTYNLAYDAENRLVQVSGAATATFGYDGDGQRVIGTEGGATTVYIGNYYEWHGTITDTIKYYYAGTERVAMRTGMADPLWMFGDHLGSTSVVANYDGSLYARQGYYAWGERRFLAGDNPLPTTFHYTGQRESASFGLYFYGARWYDAYLSRFTSPDTIIPNQYNPLAYDRYSYVFNNPIRFIDPSGFKPCSGRDAGMQGGCTPENDPFTKDEIIDALKYENSFLRGLDLDKLSKDQLLNAYNKLSNFHEALTNLSVNVEKYAKSPETWSAIAAGFDTMAWFIDLYDAGVVTAGGIYGAGLTSPAIPLCDYNSETTPANNLVCRAEEKQDVSEHEW